MRYRKKPVEIEAVQYIAGATTEQDEALVRHLEGCPGWHVADDGIVIPTLEGDHLARPGDWIIRGVQGEFCPCKPDIFESTYEPVFTR